MATLRRSEKQTSEELREQILLEIENKSKACSNATYACSLPRIDGYEYCLKHILRDTSGSYKQCAFIYPNGRKCTNALPKYDIKKDPTLTAYCFEHSRQAQLNKTRAAVGKFRIVDSNDVLLNNLVHHINIKKPEEGNSLTRYLQDEEIDVVSPQEDTFVGYKQVEDVETALSKPSKRRRILDYASDSSSDCTEPVCFRNTTQGLEFQNSDDESNDSGDENALKHAEIFTRQEIVRISAAKLTKLQSLYIAQTNQLYHLLKDRRRKYLCALRKEREKLSSIHDQPKETRRERLLYKQLKAFNTYHQRHGVEAVLNKKFKEKRTVTTDSLGGYKQPNVAKCIYTEGGVKCAARTLPGCKYCRKHILEDKKQTLFRACSVDKTGVVCQDAIPCIFDDPTCVLHLPFPAKKSYIQKKYESETEEDDMFLASAGERAYKAEFDDMEQIGSPNISHTLFDVPLTPTFKADL